MTPPPPSKADLQTLAYHNLTTFFTTHQDEITEIEILPPGLDPEDGLSMQDGVNIGVPKKILALAFLEARARFFRERAKASHDNTYTEDALDATRVILLFDPEYLTAANHRKCALLHHVHPDDSAECETRAKKLVHRELVFLNSILTSPLHRQSKSPTLWHHRYWLFAHFLLPSFSNPKLAGPEKGPAVVEAFFLAELQAVCKSSQRHPKNYYAFQYARRLFDAISKMSTDTPLRYLDTLLANSISLTRDWCIRHPSDISGWSFLCFLLGNGVDTQSHVATVLKTLDYALRVRLTNESLWIFVRGVVQDGTELGTAETLRNTMLQRMQQVLRREEEMRDRERMNDGEGERKVERIYYGEGDQLFIRKVAATTEWMERLGGPPM